MDDGIRFAVIRLDDDVLEVRVATCHGRRREPQTSVVPCLSHCN
jgi:hypothetical protein